MLRKFLFTSSPESSFKNELAMTFFRVFAGLTMAFAHGIGKMPPNEQFIGGVESLGFPVPSLFAWLAALSEFAGGLLVAIGFLTRPAATFLSITMLVAAFGVHINDPFRIQEMSLLYFAIFFMFAVRGSGRLSIDNQIK